jgi:hypothetical protein
LSPLPGDVRVGPLGIASDSLDNTGVSNSGVIPSPCTSGQTFPDLPPDDPNIDGSVV